MQVLEEEASNIDLLLCELVLPGGVSGPELAAKVKNLYPKLKLVFMSGYAAPHRPVAMSVMGQERTLAALDFMSAIPPKADVNAKKRTSVV